ncbi:hypothetical protein Tco_0742069 [Tanacetum coccineum]
MDRNTRAKGYKAADQEGCIMFDEANIRPIYHEEPWLNTNNCEIKIFATGQQHTKQTGITHERRRSIPEVVSVEINPISKPGTDDLPKDNLKVKIADLRYDWRCNVYGKMPTKIELTLEQSQQGVSNDVLVSIEGVEE